MKFAELLFLLCLVVDLINVLLSPPYDTENKFLFTHIQNEQDDPILGGLPTSIIPNKANLERKGLGIKNRFY